MYLDKKTKTTKAIEISLNGNDIIDLLKEVGMLDNAMPSASVTFHVPGGGDWSNMSIDITKDNPITVFYKETYIDGDESE